MTSRSLRVLTAVTALTALTVSLLAAAPAPATAVGGPAAPRPLAAVADVGAFTGVVYHGLLYFPGRAAGSGMELWATDGTPAGTRMVTDLVPGSGSSLPVKLVAYADRLFFAATTPATGYEWWSTDGTAAGTRLLTDINPGTAASFPGDPVVAGGSLWFAASDPTFGRELWRTDGTAAGTLRVADLRGGVADSSPYELTAFGSKVVFGATDAEGARKPYVASAGAGVVRLDNGDAVTDLVPGEFTVLGNRVLFRAGDQATQGVELWATSGSAGDAVQVKDIYPGFHSGAPDRLTVQGNRVWFQAVTPDQGVELWASDGTAQGTFLAEDVWRGDDGSDPTNLRQFGDSLLFDADDGVHGTELWAVVASAPTDAQLFVDVLPGSGSGTLQAKDYLVTSVGAVSLFTGVDAGGAEPWVTDGTAAGTRRLADLAPGPAGSSPYTVGVLGDTVVFVATAPGESLLYTWSPSWPATDVPLAPATPVGSRTSAHPQRHYSPAKAHRKRITVPVMVTTNEGSPLTGGTVTVALRGKVLGSAPLDAGTARVRLTRRLRPHRGYLVTATWSGTAGAAGSTSEPFRIRVR